MTSLPRRLPARGPVNQQKLEQRLAAAEAVCLMYGWSPSRSDTARDKACHELWVRWLHLVPESFTDPRNHPDLDDYAVELMAAERDRIRRKTLAKIAGTTE